MHKGKQEAVNLRRQTSACVGVRIPSPHLIVLSYCPCHLPCFVLASEETIASSTEAIFTSQMSSEG